MTDLAMSRRAVTRALFLSPAVVAAPVAAAPVGLVCAPAADTAAWDAAMTHYKAIVADAEHFWRNVEDRVDAMIDRYPNGRERLKRLIDMRGLRDRSNAYGDAVAEAKDAARNTPAPTLAALAVKADLYFGDDECNGDGYGPAWHQDTLAPFISDLRRFAGEEVA